ncbi:iron chaperone [Anaerosphaera aminiphila]|uniref:iron chaperone n=1 Tax=Anaerosphaera aminiphila TaxID=1120994 RepID=UPI0013566D1A|nr:DUF1801 domain-containing protein [Anaerosphaera aminiphila]
MKEIITIEDYFLNLSEIQFEKLDILRKAILSASDNISEKIAWGVPTFYYKSKYLAQIETVKGGIAFYTSPMTKNTFKDQLNAYKKTSKNSVHFSIDENIPADLIRKMINERILEVK